MAVDLNKLAEKLNRQREISVTRDGQLTEANGSSDNRTKLEPKRFYSVN
jgi:hypothetical protein